MLFITQQVGNQLPTSIRLIENMKKHTREYLDGLFGVHHELEPPTFPLRDRLKTDGGKEALNKLRNKN